MKALLLKAFPNLGLLIVRVGLGVMMALHGWPKICGGPENWEKLGGAMANLGISFAPTFWGFMAAVAEFGGGLLLAAGLLTRPASLMLAFTMVVAVLMHHSSGDSFLFVTSRPFELMLVFVAIAFTGAGKFSFDARLETK